MAKYFSMDGWVCGQIETRSTSNGKQVTQFSINSPERRQTNGEWETIPHFFKCQYWHRSDRDRRAGYIRDKAHIHISGEPRYEEWEGQNGKRSAVRFNVREILLIAPRDAQQPEPQLDQQCEVYDEDIPF